MIAFIFLLVGIVGTGIFAELGSVGFPVNLFLATFNMIPVMPLDGAKVFRWNKVIWAAVLRAPAHWRRLHLLLSNRKSRAKPRSVEAVYGVFWMVTLTM